MGWNPNPIIPDDNYVKTEHLEKAQDNLIRAKSSGAKVKINVAFLQTILNELIKRRYLERTPTLSSSLKFISKAPSRLDSSDQVTYSSSDIYTSSDVVSDSDVEVSSLEELDTSLTTYTSKPSFYESKRGKRQHVYVKSERRKYWAEDESVRHKLMIALLLFIGLILIFCITGVL